MQYIHSKKRNRIKKAGNVWLDTGCIVECTGKPIARGINTREECASTRCTCMYIYTLCNREIDEHIQWQRLKEINPALQVSAGIWFEDHANIRRFCIQTLTTMTSDLWEHIVSSSSLKQYKKNIQLLPYVWP